MDVSFLEPVFSRPGPYATVCADVTHTTATADTELDLLPPSPARDALRASISYVIDRRR